MFNKSFLCLFLINIKVFALEPKSQLKTLQNSPDLYAKVLRLWSLQTGFEQSILAKSLHSKIEEDMNDSKVIELIDFQLDLIIFGLPSTY